MKSADLKRSVCDKLEEVSLILDSRELTTVGPDQASPPIILHNCQRGVLGFIGFKVNRLNFQAPRFPMHPYGDNGTGILI